MTNMHSLNREKFYNAINSFMLESMSVEKAADQAKMHVDNMFEIISDIDHTIHNDITGDTLLQKFHKLKGILLYGDFYYESDLCEDIEIELRKSKNIKKIQALYYDLIENLKSDD
jgi:hypothetical protein